MVFLRPSGPTSTVLISYASAGDSGASGETKSPNEGPAFSESLNDVAGRARFGGSCGRDDDGESMVVANAREHGVRDREMGRNVDLDKRHRVRGMEAAMTKSMYVQRKGRVRNKTTKECREP
jgi:hypothetical protein